MNTPYFSIIVPSYNNARLISRAINSCMSQEYLDFEVIVVDDASTDDTVDIVNAYKDSRLFLKCNKTNIGVGGARNAGVEVAKGKWFIFLDGDDELIPGALKIIYNKTLQVGTDISQLRFMCQWDTDKRKPLPSLRDEVWDYEGYIRFLEHITLTGGYGETTCCARANTFHKLLFPDDRAYENLYHLDFSKSYKTRTFPDIVKIYHTDSLTQNSFVPNISHWINVAPCNARMMDIVFKHHGAALKLWAPSVYCNLFRVAAKFHFLAGQRLKGIYYMRQYLSHKPFSPVGWQLVFFGMLGAGCLARMDGFRRWYRFRKIMLFGE